MQCANTLTIPSFTGEKDSENLKTCFCPREMVENQLPVMLVIFGSQGCNALKTDMILSWKSLHGLRKSSRNHCL